MHEQWANDFTQQQQAPGRTASWNQIWDEQAGPSKEWATEFGKTEAATVHTCLFNFAHRLCRTFDFWHAC